MAQDIAQEQVVKWLKENIAQQKSELAEVEGELAEVQAKAEKLKASIVSYELILARVAPDEVALTPTDVFSETETLTLNESQVALTSSFCADEHLKGGLPNVNLASPDADLEKARSQNRHQRNPVELTCLRKPSSSLRYSPFRSRTAGARIWTRTPSPSASTKSVICCTVWLAMGLPQLVQ